jgi:hypothetical protein
MLFKGSFEDFIYIIIGLIWIGFSIYKGAMKNKALKNQSPPDDTPEVKPKSVFDNFLDNLMREEEQQPYKPVDVQSGDS